MGIGVGVADAVGAGDADGVGTGEGVGDASGLGATETVTPLLQTSFLPFFKQVKLFPAETFFCPTVLQTAPAFSAAEETEIADTGIIRIKINVTETALRHFTP